MQNGEPADRRLGHSLIDGEHQFLFDTFRRVQSLSRTDVAELRAEISKLTDYANRHFRDEEDLMRGASYPRIIEHAAQQSRIRGELRVLATLAEYGFSDAVAVIVAVLTGWMEEHVNEHDRPLASFLTARS